MGQLYCYLTFLRSWLCSNLKSIFELWVLGWQLILKMLPPPTFSKNHDCRYGVAMIRRLLQIIRLFCRLQSRSFAEYSLYYRALLQKRLKISRSLLIVATPHLGISQQLDVRWLDIVEIYCHFTFLKGVRRGIPQLCTYMCMYVHTSSWDSTAMYIYMYLHTSSWDSTGMYIYVYVCTYTYTTQEWSNRTVAEHACSKM